MTASASPAPVPTAPPVGTLFAEEIGETFASLGRIVGAVNVGNGWDTSRAMAARESSGKTFDAEAHVTHKIASLALVMTEVAEAIEELRHGHGTAESYFNAFAPDKPEGVPSELADVVIRCLDFADAWGINLGAAIVQKVNFNATRSLRHGGKTL